MKLKFLFEVLKDTCSAAWSNKIFDQSARLAFYFLLSLFPFLIVLLLVLGLVVQSQTDLNEMITNSLSSVAPPTVVKLIQKILTDLGQGASSGRLSFALLLSVWSASRSIEALIDSLNQSFAVTEFRPWWKRTL
nr:YihY/virulence factor BrkB family protein [Bdellovibrionales bacterium]